MTLQETKIKIWDAVSRCEVNLQVAADKAGVRLPITQVHEAEKLLKSLTRKVKKKIETPRWCIERYEAAHKEYFARTYPAAYKDGHYPGMEPEFPDVGTGNGLNKFMASYLIWKGHRATRINVQGRLIETAEKMPSGAELRGKKYIKSTTRKGAADVSSTIFGKSCQWEGKAGRDKPRPEQIREQTLERAAGGVYEFVHSPEEFFMFYDKVVSSISMQTALL